MARPIRRAGGAANPASPTVGDLLKGADNDDAG